MAINEIDQEAMQHHIQNDVIENLFANLPDDVRYKSNTYERVDPSSMYTIDTTSYKFTLQKKLFPYAYQINDVLLCVQAEMRKADNTKLPTPAVGGATIAPVNNVLHSMFSNCEMTINDIKVSQGITDFYHYKSFFEVLFTYGVDPKTSFLQGQGWHEDITNNHCSVANTALPLRAMYFQSGMDMNASFSDEGATFVGKLYHELANCDRFLPPLTKVGFSLTKSADSFVLMNTTTTDNEKYRMVIKQIYLMVPVLHLSEPLHRELEFKWKKSKVALTYFYRTYRMLRFELSSKMSWKSEFLFPSTDNPIRVYLAIVPTTALSGDYHSNPFEFRNKWEYKVTSASSYNAEDVKSCYADLLKEYEQKASQKISLEMLQSIRQLTELIAKKSEESGDSSSTLDEQDVSLGNTQVEENQPLKRKTRASTKTTDPKKIKRSTGPSVSATTTNESAPLLSASPAQSTSQQGLLHSAASMFKSALGIGQEDDVQSQASFKSVSTEKTSQSDPDYEPPSFSTVEEKLLNTTKTIRLKKLQLLIGNNPVDKMESNITENQAIIDFIRTNQTNGFFNSLFGNHVTYKRFFNEGYFVTGYDLSSGRNGGVQAFCVPTTRIGNFYLIL
jgi:hypothetical protein